MSEFSVTILAPASIEAYRVSADRRGVRAPLTAQTAQPLKQGARQHR